MTENNGDERPEAQPELMAYIALCRRIYERMKREGFPWDQKAEGNDHRDGDAK